MSVIPAGGSSKKKTSRPKISDVSKAAVIAISGNSELDDADEANLISAKSTNDALAQLKIVEEVEVQKLDGSKSTEPLAISKMGDIVGNGLIKKLPTLAKQKRQMNLLHNLHRNLKDNYRFQKDMEQLLNTEKIDEKEAMIAFLKAAAAEMLSEFN